MKSDSELRVLIAEACGWEWFRFEAYGKTWFELLPPNSLWAARKGGIKSERPGDLDEVDLTGLRDYPKDLNAIQQVVLAQDEEFQMAFNDALCHRANEVMKCWMHQLTARDWCLCFVKVWEQRKALR